MSEVFCAVPEATAAAANTNCRWPHSPVRWTIGEKLDEFDDEAYKEILTNAIAIWEAVSGLRTEYVESNANIVCLARHIDGPRGILAEAQLPCGNVNESTQLWVRFDVGEAWVNAQNPPQQRMDLFRVAGHEFGHSWGIGHIEGVRALMNPFISDVRGLMPPDINEQVDRYGKVPPQPPNGGGQTPCYQLARYFIGSQNFNSQDEQDIIRALDLTIGRFQKAQGNKDAQATPSQPG